MFDDLASESKSQLQKQFENEVRAKTQRRTKFQLENIMYTRFDVHKRDRDRVDGD